MTRERSSHNGWSVVVPVRDFTTAKTRLRGVLPDVYVAEIARTLAIRGVEALQRCQLIERICVVSDTDLSDDLASGKARVLVQRSGGGLNAAVREGIALVTELAPYSPVLVIHADLPGVTTSAISALLTKARLDSQDSYLPDRDGRGTTLLTLVNGSERLPAFGAGSAARHAAQGFSRIELSRWSGLRNDLDTFDDFVTLMGGAIELAQPRRLAHA